MNAQDASPRAIVLIDAQNIYRGARRAFFGDNAASSRDGQYAPRALAELLAARHRDGQARTLLETRIYTGRPDGFVNPRGHAANVRQCRAWEESGVVVHQRPLQYVNGRSPTEKGIDVSIAVDLMNAAASGRFDVAVVCSADTDLIPAIEAVMNGYAGSTMAVEVAGWREGQYGQRIWIPGRDLPVNWLYRDNYDAVHDPTDYNIRS